MEQSSTPKKKTQYTGVYTRESTHRKLADGTPDYSISISYMRSRKFSWENIGWASEGYTLEDAVEIRRLRVEEEQRRRPPQKSRRRTESCRVKTRYPGVYMRESKKETLPDGKPDRCFYITLKRDGKKVLEKLGWVSEGYNALTAAEIRGLRIRQMRHPEIFAKGDRAEGTYVGDQPQVRRGVTVDDVWAKYEILCLPLLKNGSVITGAYRQHIGPRFGSRLADSIGRLDIESFRAELATVEKCHGSGNLSKAYINMILNFLEMLLKKGNEWGMVRRVENLASTVRFKNADKERDKWLTPEDANRLLDGLCMTNHDAYYCARISLYSGMRLGEIMSLRRHDIDLTARVASVDGKTGQRTVIIHDNLVGLFTLLKNREGGELCIRVSRQAVEKNFAKVVDQIGLNDGVTDSWRKVVFHTLRHTFCSWLAMKGVPLYTISLLAGHKSPRMTQRYAKLSPNIEREALNTL